MHITCGLTCCRSVEACGQFTLCLACCFSGNAASVLWQVVTISGRTIKKEAQADPERARVAIACIETLLNKLPKEELARAAQLRLARNDRPVAS